MKCQCGNELGKPVVSPCSWSIIDEKTKKELPVNFMAGFVHYQDGSYKCWYCAKPLLFR